MTILQGAPRLEARGPDRGRPCLEPRPALTWHFRHHSLAIPGALDSPALGEPASSAAGAVTCHPRPPNPGQAESSGRAQLCTKGLASTKQACISQPKGLCILPFISCVGSILAWQMCGQQGAYPLQHLPQGPCLAKRSSRLTVPPCPLPRAWVQQVHTPLAPLLSCQAGPSLGPWQQRGTGWEAVKHCC